MKREEFLNLFTSLLEMEKGALKGDERLKDIEQWDSLGLISFIAMLDEHFHRSLPAQKIQECRTVNDLMGLVGDQIED